MIINRRPDEISIIFSSLIPRNSSKTEIIPPPHEVVLSPRKDVFVRQKRHAITFCDMGYTFSSFKIGGIL